MSGDTRVINSYNYGSVAHAIDAVAGAETKRIEMPPVKHTRIKDRARAEGLSRRSESVGPAMSKRVPGISVFSVFGTLVVSVLMVLVVLAQISYNEAASESVRLSAQVMELTEQHRVMELAFESSINIKEVERIARDELGMSRPDAAQVVVIRSEPRDYAIVVYSEDDDGVQGFAEFIRSLTDYFRR